MRETKIKYIIIVFRKFKFRLIDDTETKKRNLILAKMFQKINKVQKKKVIIFNIKLFKF